MFLYCKSSYTYVSTIGIRLANNPLEGVSIVWCKQSGNKFSGLYIITKLGIYRSSGGILPLSGV